MSVYHFKNSIILLKSKKDLFSQIMYIGINPTTWAPVILETTKILQGTPELAGVEVASGCVLSSGK